MAQTCSSMMKTGCVEVGGTQEPIYIKKKGGGESGDSAHLNVLNETKLNL